MKFVKSSLVSNSYMFRHRGWTWIPFF